MASPHESAPRPMEQEPVPVSDEQLVMFEQEHSRDLVPFEPAHGAELAEITHENADEELIIDAEVVEDEPQADQGYTEKDKQEAIEQARKRADRARGRDDSEDRGDRGRRGGRGDRDDDPRKRDFMAGISAEAFFSPHAEGLSAIETISGIQRGIAEVKIKEQHGVPMRTSYDRLLKDNSEKFLDLLLAPEVQEEADKVVLTETGFDMLQQALSRQELPGAEMLKGLGKIVEAQKLELVTPFEVEENGKFREGSDKAEEKSRYNLREYPDQTGKHPLYLSDANGERVGPYANAEVDQVAEVKRLLQPETWLLDDATKEHYEKIMATETMVHDANALQDHAASNWKESSRPPEKDESVPEEITEAESAANARVDTSDRPLSEPEVQSDANRNTEQPRRKQKGEWMHKNAFTRFVFKPKLKDPALDPNFKGPVPTEIAKRDALSGERYAGRGYRSPIAAPFRRPGGFVESRRGAPPVTGNKFRPDELETSLQILARYQGRSPELGDRENSVIINSKSVGHHETILKKVKEDIGPLVEHDRELREMIAERNREADTKS